MKRLNLSHHKRTFTLLALGVYFLLSQSFTTAQNSASGRVVDAETMNPLQGAIIRCEDQVTKTDRYGEFRLTGISDSNAVLRASYIGYATESKSVDLENRKSQIIFELGTNIIQLEEFIVRSQASAQAEALNIQRSSSNLANVVSADALGRFPDQNVAESINRLPGISVERDQGEGRFVVIRGINPDLNSVAIDGVQLASPDAGQRATLLDTIPSEAMRRVSVFKAVLPNQPHDAIGGYINIETPSAYDQNSLIARISAQMNYSDLVEDWKQKINATYGTQFGDDYQYGFIVSASYSENSFGSDNFEAEQWSQDEDTGFYFNDDELQAREYNLNRTRLGLSANFEFKPNEDKLFYVRGSYNNYQDIEIRHRGTLLFGEEYESPESGDDEDLTSFSDFSSSSYRASDVMVQREMKDREENLRVAAISTGFEIRNGNWDFDGSLAYSLAEEDTPYDTEFSYVLGTDDAEEISENPDFIIRGIDTYNPTFSFVSGSGMDPTDAANYEFDGFDAGNQLVEETDLSAAFNARYNFSSGLINYVQTGAKARLRKKDADLTIYKDEDADLESVGADNFASFVEKEQRDAYGTNLPYLSSNFRSFFLQNRAAFDPELHVVDSNLEDFTSDENIYSAYIMAEMSPNEASSLIFGLRVEHTNFETKGYLTDEDEETIEEINANKDYTEWMPGIHYRHNFSDNLVMRASWTNTLARPSFEQSAARQVFAEGLDLDDGIAEEGEFGNPNLDPYTASNFDVSVEYYLPTMGVLSAAVFHKNIKNFIYEQVSFDQTVDLGGGNTILVEELTQFKNGDSGTITGIELAYQHQLSMLPEPFDGLSLWTNLTLSESEANVQVGDEDEIRKADFLKQSGTVGTVALSYEKYGFFMRVSGSYRSEYVDEYEEGGNDRIVDEFFQWDVSTNYQINDQLSVFANFVNVNNEPFVAYWADDKRLSQFEEYSWSANFGFKYSY